ncbi:uncharacterized protein LOC110657830 [Hevea brasiliensis]|uniref:uncharacterized protein LOC110657830 n=1 Tax=Hevea brasiliensis TaxID=3981 RepID=UPI0025CE6C52|nr:uncharacterized protein LOC110657830 [Hevea brasiliensis]
MRKENQLVEFIPRVLLRHDGPLLKFVFSTYILRSCSDMDQRLVLLSRRSVMEFSLEFLAAGFVSEKLPIALNNVSYFELFHFDFNEFDAVSCTLLSIRSSPNLQHLNITGSNYLSAGISDMESIVNF